MKYLVADEGSSATIHATGDCGSLVVLSVVVVVLLCCADVMAAATVATVATAVEWPTEAAAWSCDATVLAGMEPVTDSVKLVMLFATGLA